MIGRLTGRIAIAAGVAASAIIIGGGLFLRQPLWLEWCRRQAARDCLREDFEAAYPPPLVWRRLLAAGEDLAEGYTVTNIEHRVLSVVDVACFAEAGL